MTLCDAVAHISGKIAGSLAAVVVDRLHGFLDELIQMGAAGMAVAEGALLNATNTIGQSHAVTRLRSAAGWGYYATRREQATVFSAVKASIDNNLPIIIRLNSSDGKKTHFVTAIAYTGSCSSASSISVIDPAGGVSFELLRKRELHAMKPYTVIISQPLVAPKYLYSLHQQ